MYLTRFRVNTARIDARRLLASPQSMHAAVMSSFPGLLPTADETPRVLWRLDRNAPAEVILFIVGPSQPDLTHLVEQAGWPAAAAAGQPGWRTYKYAPFLQNLADGSKWSFRLTANPVHQIRRKDGEPTKRTAHIVPRYQLEWLVKRQETSGFRILEKPADARLTEHGDELQVIVRDQRSIDFQKRGENGRVTIKTATYDGRLEVTDVDAFRRTLTGGLGKAKAYGCGLMTLATAK
jgi:CRISPR system Cascade subunit CasE